MFDEMPEYVMARVDGKNHMLKRYERSALTGNHYYSVAIYVDDFDGARVARKLNESEGGAAEQEDPNG